MNLHLKVYLQNASASNLIEVHGSRIASALVLVQIHGSRTGSALILTQIYRLQMPSSGSLVQIHGSRAPFFLSLMLVHPPPEPLRLVGRAGSRNSVICPASAIAVSPIGDTGPPLAFAARAVHSSQEGFRPEDLQ